MNVLVVHAHPEPKSFNAAMCRVAEDEFRAQRHEVRVSDLYAQGFNPTASAHDFTAPANPDYCVYALEQRNGIANGTIARDIRAELDKLLWCDLLVLVFPLYWFSVPAILKGWFDRVFVSGELYGGRRIYDRGGAVGRRALVGVTAGSQEHMCVDGGIHGSFDDMLRPLLQGTLAYVGFGVLAPFVGWHVPYIRPEDRCRILDRWRTRLRYVDRDAPMRAPSLTDYDQNFRSLPAGSA